VIPHTACGARDRRGCRRRPPARLRRSIATARWHPHGSCAVRRRRRPPSLRL